MSYSVYFAGDLFDHKHLAGNEMLAKAIATESQGRYHFVMPQQWEGKTYTSIEIRNKDISQVAHADFGLFNFDGTDLDSGTVVEYMIAKMLDIPAVLLRTDFRSGGFNNGLDWNLMVSGYPRTRISKHASLFMYNDHGLAKTHQLIARSIIEAFDQLLQEKSLLKTPHDIRAAYAHVAKMGGSELDMLLRSTAIEELVAGKIERGLYQIDEQQAIARKAREVLHST